MPVVGAVVAGVATIGGSLIASGAAKSAANKAASAQIAADQAAIAEQRRQYDQTRTDLTPWMTAGQGAMGKQGDLIGLNGTDKQMAAITALKGSPLYESLFGNGRDAILANASATGGLRGGNTQGALANFGRDTLASVIQNQISNLGSVSEQGQNAAAQTGSFGANSANAISSLLSQQGQANAGAALASGAATASAVKDITGVFAGLANNKDVGSWVGKLF